MRDLGLEVFHLFAEILRHSALMITENSDGTIGRIVRRQLSSSYWLIAFIYDIHRPTYIHVQTYTNSGYIYMICTLCLAAASILLVDHTHHLLSVTRMCKSERQTYEYNITKTVSNLATRHYLKNSHRPLLVRRCPRTKWTVVRRPALHPNH